MLNAVKLFTVLNIICSSGLAQPDAFMIEGWLSRRKLLPTVRECPEIMDSAARYRAAVTERRLASEPLIPVVLDSLLCADQKMYLEVTSLKDALALHLSYFRVQGGCTPHWIGPVEEPISQYAKTIKSRFLCFGEARSISALARLNQVLGSAGLGLTVGDTIFVELTDINAVDPGSDVIIERFNEALFSAACDASALSRVTLVDLYLEALFPYQAVFKLNEASELDALYLFSWLSVKDPWDFVDANLAKAIRSPGIHDGRALMSLPTRPSLRPFELPSRFLRENDGHWFDHPDDTLGAARAPRTRITILVSEYALLMQLDIELGVHNNAIKDVTIVRLASVSRYFLEPHR